MADRLLSRQRQEEQRGTPSSRVPGDLRKPQHNVYTHAEDVKRPSALVRYPVTRIRTEGLTGSPTSASYSPSEAWAERRGGLRPSPNQRFAARTLEGSPLRSPLRSSSSQNSGISALADSTDKYRRGSTESSDARSKSSTAPASSTRGISPLYRQQVDSNGDYAPASRSTRHTGAVRELKRSPASEALIDRFKEVKPIALPATTNSPTSSSRPVTPAQVLPSSVYPGTWPSLDNSPTSVYETDVPKTPWEDMGWEASRPTNPTLPKRTYQRDRLDNPSPSPLKERSPSVASNKPLLETTISGTQSASIYRVPAHQRPALLNMEVLKETESRGSMTSLPDLIRRATRLASNLDRGRTASRLGLDAFLGNDRNGSKNRESTYSDVLFSFPAPVSSSPLTNRELTPTTIWPGDEKDGLRPPRPPRHRKKPAKGPRRCCGMSVCAFLIIMIVLMILIAAAILIPIFLILIPKQNAGLAGPVGCAKSNPCQNQGVLVADDGICSCICVNGYTGSQCTISGDPVCTTSDVRAGTSVYQKATLGMDIVPMAELSQKEYNIPLNNTLLLSLFSRYDMSCSAENYLIRFSATTNTSASNPSNNTQLNFGRVAVLYVLQQTRDLATAVDAQDRLSQYFKLGGLGSGQTNVTIVPNGTLAMSANFANFTIQAANGMSIGGQ